MEEITIPMLIDELIDLGFKEKDSENFEQAVFYFSWALSLDPMPDLAFYLMIDCYWLWNNLGVRDYALTQLRVYVQKYLPQFNTQLRYQFETWMTKEISTKCSNNNREVSSPMKPTKEIIGLRIISILDGTQVGVVKDLVLNPQEKTLDFIIVDQPSDYLGAKIIAFKDILGLGEFAITIPHPGVIQDVAQNTEAQNLLKQDIRVLGTKVLTKKGQLIGEVTEILIDGETGQMSACLFDSERQVRQIRAEQVITLGKELLIVDEVQAVSNQQVEEPSCEDQSQTPDMMDLTEEAS